MQLTKEQNQQLQSVKRFIYGKISYLQHHYDLPMKKLCAIYNQVSYQINQLTKSIGIGMLPSPLIKASNNFTNAISLVNVLRQIVRTMNWNLRRSYVWVSRKHGSYKLKI